MEDIQVCSNWEDIAENSAVLEQQLEKLRLQKAQQAGASGIEPKIRILTRNKSDNKNELKFEDGRNESFSSPIVLDSTREDSLRSQYVPPEPKIKLLTRPKNNTQGSSLSNGFSSKSKSQAPVKTLEQREKEYMEARKRILGDVQFSDPEEEYDGMSPAEALKQKISQVLTPREGDEKDVVSEEEKKSLEESVESGEGAAASQKKSKSRGKKNREKFKTPNIESPRDFPTSRVDLDRILRMPRGPDGTTGFHR